LVRLEDIAGSRCCESPSQAKNGVGDPCVTVPAVKPFKDREPLPVRYFVLIPCHSERHQRELLDRFLKEGIPCEAKMG
jgi:hypothetical protein